MTEINEILMKKLLSLNAMQKFKEIGIAMGLDIRHMTPMTAADKTLEAIERLRNDVGIHQIPFKEFGFTEKDVEHTAKWSLNDISLESNPRDMTADQAKEIMRSCI